MRQIEFRAFIKSLETTRRVDSIYIEDEYISVYEGEFQMGDTVKVKNSDCVIMQFTGLQDKNGVDIYEGDILSVGKSALEFDFKNSKAGELMKSRNIDELIIEVKMFDYLQVSTTVFLKKENCLVRDCDYWELTEEDYQSMKNEEIEKYKKPWCEKSTDIQFLRYCSKYASIIGNIHDNPELLK